MKKAISIWSFPEHYSVKKFIKVAQSAGFEGVELSMSMDGDINLTSNDDELTAIKKYALDHHITIHGVASNLSWNYSFADNDKEERKRAYDVTVRQIQIAKTLGATSIIYMPGAVYSELFRSEKPPLRYDIAHERNLEALLKLKPVAEKYEIDIAIENVWNKMYFSPLEMRELIDAVESPFVGAYFDVGNIMPYGFPEHWIPILDWRIKKIHFKDFKYNTVQLDGFSDLLSGEVNWPAVVDAIKEIGYKGWITSEVQPYRYYPEQIAYNSSANIDVILNKRVDFE
jgi:hexulose-6-phosphate isomerase